MFLRAFSLVASLHQLMILELKFYCRVKVKNINFFNLTTKAIAKHHRTFWIQISGLCCLRYMNGLQTPLEVMGKNYIVSIKIFEPK